MEFVRSAGPGRTLRIMRAASRSAADPRPGPTPASDGPRCPRPHPAAERPARSGLRSIAATAAVAIAAAWGPTLAAPLAAQEAVQRDSAAAVADARSAQSRFERDRVRYLPYDRSGFSGSSCDERVGRMCLWLEGRSDWWWPEREAADLLAARDELIDALSAAALDAPGDPWVIGQLVIYLGEAGRWTEARASARRCGLAPTHAWWCAALEGTALHVLGDYPAAEEAFARALGGMDATEAWRWRQLRDLLDGPGRDAESKARERGDGAAAPRFWALSDPLFLVPGSDRWTEHMARRTWNYAREDARNPYAMSWGDDLEEIVLRYGWEVGWERNPPLSGSFGARSSAVGHQDPRSQGFVAPAAAWDPEADSAPEAWNPGSRPAPRTGYAPAYAPTFLDLTTTVAVLPRGDSAVVVTAFPGLPSDTTFHADHTHPPAPAHADFGTARRRGLFAASLDARVGDGDPSGVPLDSLFERHARVAAGLEGALALDVPSGRWVVSAEVWDAAEGTAARMRRTIRIPRVPPDVLTLSDLLPARPIGPAVDALEAVLPGLLAEIRYAPGDTIRVGWEVNGLGWNADEPLDYTLSLRQGRGGFFARLGRTLGVVDDPRGLHLEWSEVGPAAPEPRFRVVDLVVPPDFEVGDYRLTLELRTAGRATAVSERAVRVGGG